MRFVYSILFCFLLTPILAFSQQDLISVEIVLESLGFSEISRSGVGNLFSGKAFGGDKSVEGVFKFYYDEPWADHLITNPCIVLVGESPYSAECSKDPYLKNLRNLKVFQYNAKADSLVLRMENYRNMQGDSCVKDSKDDKEDVAEVRIALSALKAGEFSGPIRIISAEKRYFAVLRIRYSIPDPAPIVQEAPPEINDPKDEIALSSHVDLANKGNLSYQWEYKIGPDAEWQHFPATTKEEKIRFKPATDIFRKPLRKTTNLHVRMKAMSTDLHSSYTPELLLPCTPPKPVADTANRKLIPSCRRDSTGAIVWRGIKSAADSIAYFVVRGAWTDSNRKPEDVPLSEQVGGGAAPADSLISVRNLAKGGYTLLLYNAGMRCGKVYDAQPFSITEYEPLTTAPVVVTDATCDSLSDGVIQIRLEGGGPGTPIVTWTPSDLGTLSDLRNMDMDNRVLTLSGVPSGVYTFFIKGPCGTTISPPNVYVGTKRPAIASTVTLEPVNDAGKGAIQVALQTTASDKRYKYILTKNHAPFKSQEVSTPAFAISDLEQGIYGLRVFAVNEACAIVDTSLKISFQGTPALAQTDATTPQPTIAGVAEVRPSGGPLPAMLFVNGLRDTTASETSDPEHQYYRIPLRNSITYRSFQKDGIRRNGYYIVVEKLRCQLHVYDADSQLLITYPIALGRSDAEDKQMENDKATPEGEYRILDKRTHRKWQKFFALDYPNNNDKTKFEELKRQKKIPANAKIGHSVGIHGTWAEEDITIDARAAWTDGCVSTKNSYIDELYSFIPVGTKVIIRK